MPKKQRPKKDDVGEDDRDKEDDDEEQEDDFLDGIEQDLKNHNKMGTSTTTSERPAPQQQQQEHRSSTSSTSESTTTTILLPNSQLPFVGRESEIQTVVQAGERISLEWMENPKEIIFIHGKQGIGKTTLVQHALQQGSFWKAIIIRGICEEYHTANLPFGVLVDLLKDLTNQLLPQKAVWGPRLQDALGGEGPLIASLIPSLCPFLQCLPLEQRGLIHRFDMNTPHRYHRLSFAIRDLIQAVSEYQPVVMMIDNLHWADPDTLFVFQHLLMTDTLHNFLFLGIYDDDSHMVVVETKEEEVTPTPTTTAPSGDVDADDSVDGDDGDDAAADPASDDHAPTAAATTDDAAAAAAAAATATTSTAFVATTPLEILYKVLEEQQEKSSSSQVVLREISLLPLSRKDLEISLLQVFPYREEELSDLVDFVSALSKGNPFYACQLLKLWNEIELITYVNDPIKVSDWEWNRKKLKKEVKRAKEERLNTYDDVTGIIEARLKLLPRKIQFVVHILARMNLSHFRLSAVIPPVDGATGGSSKNQQQQQPPPPPPDHLYNVFVKAVTNRSRTNDDVPIASSEELIKMAVKACTSGFLKRNGKAPVTIMSFTNDLIRKCSSTIQSDIFEQQKKKDTQNDPLVGLYVGTELSKISATAGKVSMKLLAASNGKVDAAIFAAEQVHERCKFLAAEALYQCKDDDAMKDSERASMAKIHLEAAEMAVGKTAFHAATIYLERAMTAFFNVNSKWQDPQQYEVTVGIYLLLARMYACFPTKYRDSKKAVEEIFIHGRSLKDRVLANQVQMVVLQAEGNYDKALTDMLDLLSRLGETFPAGDGSPDQIEKQFQGLRKAVEKTQNDTFLKPKKVTDNKLIDVMTCLADLEQIGRQVQHPNPYSELAMIRMMKLSMQYGFTRQYPIAFSLYAMTLKKKGHIKEAYRMGQIMEKMTRISDFYGGHAMTLFHWYVSHWRRTYKRNLEPVLQIYNAQLDAGDFFHVGFSISTYIQYHLVSGFDLDKLSENMQLFQDLYTDYNLAEEWQIQIPQQAIAAFRGESHNPTTFFGDTLAQQEDKLNEFQNAGLQRAVDYCHLLRLFVAFFFHDYEVMQESINNLTRPVSGVWVPWMSFMECFLLIQCLGNTTGKEKKELMEKIEVLKDRLMDWYHHGAPNPSVMFSILEAEYIIHTEGLKKLSAMKVQMMYKEAIDAAVKDGATHLEAFACERAGFHFMAMVVHGSCAEFLSKSQQAYDRCNYVAKVIDLETKYADILQVANRRVRPASAYLERNANAVLRGPSDQQIGGGMGEVKSVNVFKELRKVTKVKDMFKRDKTNNDNNNSMSSPRRSTKSGLSLDIGEGDPENHPQSPLARKSPTTKRSSRGGYGSAADNDDDGEDVNGGDGSSRFLHMSPSALSPGDNTGSSNNKNNNGKKQGRLSKLLFRGGQKKSTDAKDDNTNENRDKAEKSPKSPERARRGSKKTPNDIVSGDDGMAAPFGDDDADIEGGEVVSSSKDPDEKKKKSKEKKSKEKKTKS